MSDKIKPCPFCGAHEVHIAKTEVYWLRCEECDSEGKTSKTKKGAIAAWNTRAEDSEALMAQVEELREALTITNTHHGSFGEQPWINNATALAALSKTPQQSLDSLKARIEEETIDRCANKIEEVHGMVAGSLELDLMPRKYQPSTKAAK